VPGHCLDNFRFVTGRGQEGAVPLRPRAVRVLLLDRLLLRVKAPSGFVIDALFVEFGGYRCVARSQSQVVQTGDNDRVVARFHGFHETGSRLVRLQLFQMSGWVLLQVPLECLEALVANLENGNFAIVFGRLFESVWIEFGDCNVSLFAFSS